MKFSALIGGLAALAGLAAAQPGCVGRDTKPSTQPAKPLPTNSTGPLRNLVYLDQ
jgi:hypothetical protein